VADPEILKMVSQKTIHKYRYHLSQVHTTSYVPFILEKAAHL